MEAIIAKNRNGLVGNIKLAYLNEFQIVGDLDTIKQEKFMDSYLSKLVELIKEGKTNKEIKDEFWVNDSQLIYMRNKLGMFTKNNRKRSVN